MPEQCGLRDRVDIAVSVLAPGWRTELPWAARVARRAARAALAAVARPAGPAELSVALADDTAVRRLNRQYRGIDRATNVLSFPTAAPAGAGALPLGDVVLAHETVAAEARAQGKVVADHVSHLVVHGVLHLLGYDHERTADAEIMERLEIAILAGLGVADPYKSARA